MSAYERNARHYNQRTREVSYKPGQKVYLRNFQQSDFAKNYNAKLGRQWTPARIRRKIGTCTYEVEDRTGKKIKVTYHAKDIRT